MLKLTELIITFKGYKARSFRKENNNGIKLLQEYLEDPSTIPEDISKIQVSSFKNLYREVAWMFSRITGQESMETIP
jgi:hypothetical protein